MNALMDSILKSVNTDVVSKNTVKPDGTWVAFAACQQEIRSVPLGAIGRALGEVQKLTDKHAELGIDG